MGLETATSIEGLDETWPTGLDPINQGDNHIRLVKAVLKDQFPGAGGQGFASPILASEAELNFSVGLAGVIQDQLDSLTNQLGIIVDESVPIGSIVLYNAAFANIPANWQLCDGTNGTPDMVDKFLYGTQTQGQVGDTGGFADSIVVSHTHTSQNDGAHTHNFDVFDQNNNNGGNPNGVSDPQDVGNAATKSAGDHNHTINSTGVTGVGKNIPPFIKMAYIQRMT